MAWCNDDSGIETRLPSSTPHVNGKSGASYRKACPSCGHLIQCQEQGGIQNLPGLPAGVKFDPTDQEILEHLEAKVRSDVLRLHPLIDKFIPTLEGDQGICYTHPEKLPGVSRDGLIRHFFHRPSKAYTTGTRKRRKVQTEEDGSETRWHKTGKTRPVFAIGRLIGYKKILVLYTNYGKQRKPEKTNWVMHQYHLGSNEEEKDGELVVSKVFYQTQPRQCSSGVKDLFPNSSKRQSGQVSPTLNEDALVEYYNNTVARGYHEGRHNSIPNCIVHVDGSSFLRKPSL